MDAPRFSPARFDSSRLAAAALASTLLMLGAPSPVARAQAPPRFDHVREMLPLGYARGNAVAAGDLDGDQVPDLVILHGFFFKKNSDIVNRVLLGNGRGLYTDVGFLPFIKKGIRASEAALGDVDGDADLDIVLGMIDHRNALYLNDGSGGFVDATQQTPFNLASTTAVVLGDVDGDTDVDVVFGNHRDKFPNRQTQLFLNDGTGGFTDVTTTHVPPDNDDTSDAALGDVDGDLDLDLLLANEGWSTYTANRLYSNDGTGSFTDASNQIPSTLDLTRSLALGDVDGDQDLDAFLGNADLLGAGDRDRLLLNDGTGLFTDASASLLPFDDDETTQRILIEDFDGDGDRDAFLATPPAGYGAGTDRYYRNDGTGSFADVSASVLPAGLLGSMGAAAADVDGDLDPDLVLSAYDHDRLFLNDGAGAFVHATVPGDVSFGGYPLSVATGDVDGDGDPDVFEGAGGGFADGLYRNDGQGHFTDVSSQVPFAYSNGYANDAVFLDLEGDGDLDLFLAVDNGTMGWPNRLLCNDGTGGFTDVSGQLPSGSLPVNPVELPQLSSAADAGDVDADGDVDVVAGNRASLLAQVTAQTQLLANDGTGVFTDATSQLPRDNQDTTDLALADLDGDGDLDLWLGKRSAHHLYRNDGTGHFVFDAAAIPNLGLPYAYEISIADVEGDLDLDVLSVDSNQTRLYGNDGQGIFSDASAQLPAGTPLGRATAFTDADDDGDADAWIATWGKPNVLLENDGSGFFSFASGVPPEAQRDTREFEPVDLDGDGDADLLDSDQTSVQILWNLRRHLAWREFPRVGRPLILDLWGTPAGYWSLWASENLATWTSFGGWYLARPWIPAGAGNFDTQGQATVSWIVPDRPESVGLTLYWQAALLEPRPAITNVETTTLADV